MHGTGTALGDPIEAGAAAAVLLKVSEGGAGSRLALASHKAAVGHAEAAAGVVGLSCAMLALEAGALPPILHLRSASRSALHTLCRLSHGTELVSAKASSSLPCHHVEEHAALITPCGLAGR